MYNSFYRKVGFGIGINDKIPVDPLKWAFIVMLNNFVCYDLSISC